jgi:predicted RNase H-like nuclease (RuvC/YqgF family)
MRQVMLYTAKEAQEINQTGWKEFAKVNDRLSELSEFLGCSVWVEEEFDSLTQVATTLHVRIATNAEKKDSLSQFLAQVQKIKNIDRRRAAFIATTRKHSRMMYVVK